MPLSQHTLPWTFLPLRSFYQDWHAKFEHLADMVVPRSSRLIFEDSDHGLYTVTLFSKVVDEYKLHARENKWVRDIHCLASDTHRQRDTWTPHILLVSTKARVMSGSYFYHLLILDIVVKPLVWIKNCETCDLYIWKYKNTKGWGLDGLFFCLGICPSAFFTLISWVTTNGLNRVQILCQREQNYIFHFSKFMLHLSISLYCTSLSVSPRCFPL